MKHRNKQHAREGAPVREIGGWEFHVDVPQGRLIQIKDPRITIDAIEMLDNGLSLEFPLNSRTGDIDWEDSEKDEIKYCFIRYISWMDPEWMFKQIENGNHPPVPEEWKDLGRLSIGGEEFYIHPTRYLRQVANPWNLLDLRYDSIESDGKKVLYIDSRDHGSPLQYSPYSTRKIPEYVHRYELPEKLRELKGVTELKRLVDPIKETIKRRFGNRKL